ncbi:hypothetical protein GCM10020358_58040 [Amorphoplanes nipponensis]|uniref:DUF2637 domain-containing protein n=1 Tax=Actinoplanes nipponensis TaxID=135950 RepID=A0A919MPW8_9ACTN|nr:DUF2637 domain-containing protein [Actinoplanes nipponensis]GIE52507.1 hypothetical protein Ani05nite_60410 [Actinoplanes nipponensis]
MTFHRNRLQWAVRAVLALGVAASVTANVLHARDNLISQAIAAWPPLALLVTVELVSRIPVYRRALGVVRILATTAIAGIAAWVSYHHMVAVVARYGETGTVPYLLPLSVDGLIIVASICLVELSGRRDETSGPSRAAQTAAKPLPAPAAEAPPTAPRPRATPGITLAPVSRDGGPPAPDSWALLAAGPGPDQPGIDVHPDQRSITDPAPQDQSAPAPDQQGDDDQDEDGDEVADGDEDESQDDVDLAPDLVPLLPAARTARDELIREGRTVSRDALAQRLRRNGHAIRNTRVSELLSALRREEPSPDGVRPTVSA